MSMTDSTVAEYRPAGTRNFVRVGDFVKAQPNVGNGKRPAIAKVTAIHVNAEGDVVGVSVVFRFCLNGTSHSRAGHPSTLSPGQISRVAQTVWARRAS